MGTETDKAVEAFKRGELEEGGWSGNGEWNEASPWPTIASMWMAGIQVLLALFSWYNATTLGVLLGGLIFSVLLTPIGWGLAFVGYRKRPNDKLARNVLLLWCICVSVGLILGTYFFLSRF